MRTILEISRKNVSPTIYAKELMDRHLEYWREIAWLITTSVIRQTNNRPSTYRLYSYLPKRFFPDHSTTTRVSHNNFHAICDVFID